LAGLNQPGEFDTWAEIKRSSRLQFIAGLLVVVIGGVWIVAMADKVILPLIVMAGNEVSTPDLTNLPKSVADSICTASRLQMTKTRTRQDDRVPPDIVIDQYPAAGTPVRPGRVIEVVISDQTGLVVCPNVIGRSPREVAIIADSAGLSFDGTTVSYLHSETEPEGIVIGQRPLAYTGVRRGERLMLTVSLGSTPVSPTVPDLIGCNLSEVKFILAKQGLLLGETVSFPDRNRTPGTVIGQNPAWGETAPTDGIVSITIAVEPLGRLGEDTLSYPGDSLANVESKR
jgi:serine/threonine-protein kinase